MDVSNEPDHFGYQAEISRGDTQEASGGLTAALRSAHPEIDLLPPIGDTESSGVAPALLDDETLRAVVRSGYTVTITGIHEGPPDPETVMSDDQAEVHMVGLLGEDRVRRGRAE